MPPCDRAGKISSTASAEFSDSKVHNVVTRSRTSYLGIDDDSVAPLDGDRKLGPGVLVGFWLRIDFPSVEVLGGNPRSDRQRFDGN
jgi:hypothetical protein